MPIIAPIAEIQVETEGVYMGFLRPRQREAAVRRMPGIVDIIRLPAAIARQNAFDLERHNSRDREAAGEAFGNKIDRLKRDPAKIADQILPNHRRGAAGLAAG